MHCVTGASFNFLVLEKLARLLIYVNERICLTRVDQHRVFGALKKLTQLGLRLLKHVFLNDHRAEILLAQVVGNVQEAQNQNQIDETVLKASVTETLQFSALFDYEEARDQNNRSLNQQINHEGIVINTLNKAEKHVVRDLSAAQVLLTVLLLNIIVPRPR